MSQFGFRKNHGTLDGLFVLRHLVDKAYFTRKPFYALFIDFEKAFDRVPRSELISRCKQLGCSGEFLDAMVNMLDNIQMQVKCNGDLGLPFQTSKLGIKQGGILSPLKFGSFMEQLHELISMKLPGIGCKIGRLLVPILLYADDVTGLVTCPKDMARLIKHVELFCKLFGMRLNASKTFVVIFNNPKRSRQSHEQLARGCRWSINGQPISIKHEAKFLGNIFHDEKGCQKAPVELAAKGLRAMHAMVTTLKSHHINQFAFLCRIFDQLVKPVLSYGCQIWGPDVFHAHLEGHNILHRANNPVEGVHGDFLRLIGGLPSSCPLWIMYNEFQRTPVHFHWLALCARFWNKVFNECNDDNNVLLRESLRDNIQLFVEGCKGCWVAKFMNSLVKISALTEEDVARCATIDDFVALPITEGVVADALNQHWNKLRLELYGDPCDPRNVPDTVPNTYVRYNNWVASAGPPAHLTAFMPSHIKHMLLRLRCTSYPLAVQEGRLKKGADRIPRSLRTCKFCLAANQANTEDDLHFLLECPAYNHIRHLYPTVFRDKVTVASIINTSNQPLLGKAIQSMLHLRSTF